MNGISGLLYINLGFMLNWQLAPNTNLRAGIDVTHYSNGNTHYPNSGVNTIGASVGVTHFFGNGAPERILSSGLQRENTFHRYVSYDLIVYGATRKRGIFPADSNPVLAPGSFGILGLNFNPLYNFSKYFRAGVSLDMQYDESANIGNHVANFFCHGADNNSFYQTFVLKTNITKYLFLHTGYQLYRFKDPNNLMLGFGFRFNAR